LLARLGLIAWLGSLLGLVSCGANQSHDSSLDSWPMPNSVGLGLPNEFAYTLRGSSDEPVISDDVTGLDWQQRTGLERFDFDAAQNHCASSEYAGFADWRAPTRLELISLLDLSRKNPALLPSAFPSAPSDWYWTSTLDTANPERAWYVYFYFGYPDVDDRNTQSLVRCVRRGRAALLHAERYRVSAELVMDASSGLTWQRKASPESMSYAEASRYCSDLRLGGLESFRVPTMKELQTLVDERRSMPAFDSAMWLGGHGDLFWSSSAWSGTENLAWYVRFDSGTALYEVADAAMQVRCVR
jgi:hypothetical protein